MIKGQTKSGFKFSVNPNILNDWDFLETIEALNTGDTSLATVKKALVILLNESGFDRLKNHIKTRNNGITDVNMMVAEIAEIMEALNIKNS